MALGGSPTSQRDFRLELSLNGTTWVDVCAVAMQVRAITQDRTAAITHTACDGPLLSAGAAGAVTLEARFVFTEASNEAFALALTAHEADGNLFLRYTPRASTDDPYRYVTAKADGTLAPGIVTRLLYPDGDAAGAALFAAGFTLAAARLKREAVPGVEA